MTGALTHAPRSSPEILHLTGDGLGLLQDTGEAEAAKVFDAAADSTAGRVVHVAHLVDMEDAAHLMDAVDAVSAVDAADKVAAEAAQMDPVGWHYIQVLTERTRSQTGPAQALLQAKLRTALAKLLAKLPAQQRPNTPPSGLTSSPSSPSLPSLPSLPALASLASSTSSTSSTSPLSPPLSPLSALLRDMAGPSADHPQSPSDQGRMDNPRVAQFRQQLGKIRVQKQVAQAIAQAPQNAGPINSHMLVLRSLGLMRDLSPDYLNRFMGYVDTLLFLEDSGQVNGPSKKSTAKPKRTPPC